MKRETGWGKVSDWYDGVVEDDNSYQKKVILPNLIRIIEINKDERILDLACGQGFFSIELAKSGARVVGVDIGRSLVEIAKKKSEENGINVKFLVSPSDDLSELPSSNFEKVVIVLALQNIEKMNETLSEVSRVLVPRGNLYIVLNHPVLRNAGETEWGYDEEEKIQYRRLNSYMSEKTHEIVMNPGGRGKREVTYSFHRPLQVYFKALRKAGFAVTRLEEWISHKESEDGPRKLAEDQARKEFPMFLALECKKLKSE